MPKITLKPIEPALPLPVGGVAVGTIDDQPLWYIRRTPYAGDVALAHATIAQELLDAIDEALSPLFGGDWPHSFHVVTGVSARTVQRDRIIKNGLAPAILFFIGHASEMGAAIEPPRAFGDLLLAAARMMTGREGGSSTLRLLPHEIPPIEIRLQSLLPRAVTMVGRLRVGKEPTFLRFFET